MATQLLLSKRYYGTIVQTLYIMGYRHHSFFSYNSGCPCKVPGCLVIDFGVIEEVDSRDIGSLSSAERFVFQWCKRQIEQDITHCCFTIDSPYWLDLDMPQEEICCALMNTILHEQYRFRKLHEPHYF